jgi:hypothetical protein
MTAASSIGVDVRVDKDHPPDELGRYPVQRQNEWGRSAHYEGRAVQTQLLRHDDKISRRRREWIMVSRGTIGSFIGHAKARPVDCDRPVAALLQLYRQPSSDGPGRHAGMYYEAWGGRRRAVVADGNARPIRSQHEAEWFRRWVLVTLIHRGVIRGRRREPVSGRIARSAAQFDDALGMGIFLLEAFEDLYAADATGPDSVDSRIRPVRPQREQETPAKTFKVLNYDEFMAERKARSISTRSGENALAGTHCDGVRALLNRLSGGDTEPAPEHRDDGNWMDLGDESGDLESDRVVPVTTTAPEPVSERVADRTAFERAVQKYTQNLAAGNNALGAADVLKLRLLLMTILWNAKCSEFSGGLLCSVDEHGWPRLATRAIVAFFAGKDPPIRRLVLSSEFLEMPADFLECWITVLWTVDAISAALPKVQRNKDFLGRIPALKALVIARLGLTGEELAGQTATKRAAGLDRELGRRIGLTAKS